jgi:transcriptional regulator with GAF, ATPase, and Fis domain
MTTLDLIGSSPKFRALLTEVERLAPVDSAVLIQGETGTGKEVIARAIHEASPRRNHRFVALNCAAIPSALLESELFGHERGAFTGACAQTKGRFQMADGGTLFLDEIGDMPLSLQSKILRFLEQGEVQRIGGNDNLKVDVRVVAATNADLHELVKQHLFREDLYYRLAIFPIKLPPLRERLGDVEKLANAFLAKFCPSATLSAAAVEALCRHNWPGNVRELRNVVERASIFIGGEREILPQHILL